MIKVFDPHIRTEECLNKIRSVFESNWIGMGPVVSEFENKVQRYLGCRRFVALNSGTAALHLSIKALKFKVGDKVLTTPLTCPAPNLMLLQERLTPVFYDVNPITGEPDIDSIKSLILKHDIRGLIVVHFGGYPCNMTQIQDLCDAHDIKIIEDCAHAFGSQINNRKIGNGKNLCCFSFHSLKNLTTGDGGGVATNDDGLANTIKNLSWYGGNTHTYKSFVQKKYTWDYGIDEQGMKYHMNDVVAAIGVVQIQYIDQDNYKREVIAQEYLSKLTNVTLPFYENDRKSSFHFLPVHVKHKHQVIKSLNDQHIYPSSHYKRNDDYKVFKNYRACLPGVESFCNTEITLPIHPKLTSEHVGKIIKIVNDVVCDYT